MSLYEKRLSGLIRTNEIGIYPWICRLKLACYQARRGDLASARSIIAMARKAFDAGISAVATVHINLAEAVCEFYEHGIDAAMPKLARARALSIACDPEDDAPALISVWFAALHRYRADWFRMESEIRGAIADPARISEDVRCRLGLILGDAYLEAECAVLSDQWYKYARKWAIALGDDATVGASIHNRSAFNIFNVRLSLIGNPSGRDDFGMLRTEVASANNFGTFYTDQAFAWTLELLQGQVMLLERRYEDALSLLGIDDAVEDWAIEWPAASLIRAADALLCQCILGRVDTCYAESYSDRLLRTQFDAVGPGDRAIAADSIAMALTHLKSTESVAYMKIASESLVEYRKCQEREKSSLTNIAGAIQSSGLGVLAL